MWHKSRIKEQTVGTTFSYTNIQSLSLDLRLFTYFTSSSLLKVMQEGWGKRWHPVSVFCSFLFHETQHCSSVCFWKWILAMMEMMRGITVGKWKNKSVQRLFFYVRKAQKQWKAWICSLTGRQRGRDFHLDQLQDVILRWQNKTVIYEWSITYCKGEKNQ